MATRLRTIDLPLGDSIPVLCQGTAQVGRDEARWEDEVVALNVDCRRHLPVSACAYTRGA